MWARALDLFDRCLDGDDRTTVLSAEPDAQIRKMAEHLLLQDESAEQDGFLKFPPAAVQELWRPEAPAFPIGSVLVNGRFEILEQVGKGGMGEVYRARDRKLEEDVALKTIRQHLASDERVLQQFISEIRIARKVNHRNICRIYELFDHPETPLFFSMEYLDGKKLSDQLPLLPVADRKLTALQLAEGLAELHSRGLIHRDFKPANIIFEAGSGGSFRAVIVDFGLAQRLTQEAAVASLKAGTRRYMAPEVLNGEEATVRSDIFSFGRVLAELLPGHKWAAKCQAEDPTNRPANLAPVIASLRERSRREMLGYGAWSSVAAGGSLLFYRQGSQDRPQFSGRPALALNGFRAAERSPGDTTLASTLKQLVTTALNQSPMLRLIPDETLRAALLQLNLPGALPAEWRHLRAAASQRHIPYLAEGLISTVGSTGLRLLLQLFERNSDRPFLEVDETVPTRERIVELAEKISLKLRQAIGESSTSLASNFTGLVQATSSSPEAVDLLYKGIDAYEHSRTDDALILFEKAIETDREFALAYAYAGLGSAARNSVEKAFYYFKRAMELSSRVSQREQLWIQRGYQNITANFDGMLETCQKLTTLFPDDPLFQRNLAFAFARIGRPQDGIPANRRAMELNPVSDPIKGELIVNLAQANQAGESLQFYKRFRSTGNASSQFDFGAGLAHLSEGAYDKAQADFDRMRATRKDDRQALLFRVATLILTGKFREAQWDLKADLARDVATPGDDPYFRHVRQLWLAYLDWFTDSPAEARPRIDRLLQLQPVPYYLPLFRETAMVAIKTGYLQAADRALEILKRFEAEWPSTHSKGSRSHLEGVLREARNQDGFELLNEARGEWEDPLTLGSIRDYFAAHGYWDKAREVAARIHEDRGRIFKHSFPGLFTLNQIARIKISTKLSLSGDASRMYQQLITQWDTGAEAFSMFRAIRGAADS